MTIKQTENNRQPDGRHKLTGPGPGRPKGSRNKLTTNMLEVLNDIVIPFIKDPETRKAFRNQKLIESRAKPLVYYEKLIIPLVRLLPKNVELSGDLGLSFNPYENLSNKEIAKKLAKMLKALKSGNTDGKKGSRIASKAPKKRRR